MPRFVITVFFILTFLGGTVFYIFLKISPSSAPVVFGFLFLMWVFLGGIFSLPLSYFEGKPKESKVKSGVLKPSILRDIFRKSLRRGLILSFFAVSLLILRYLNIFSSLNLLVVLVFLLLIELFWSFK